MTLLFTQLLLRSDATLKLVPTYTTNALRVVRPQSPWFLNFLFLKKRSKSSRDLCNAVGGMSVYEGGTPFQIFKE